MSFRSDIQKIPKLDRFVGGVKSDREKRNKLVDAINAMIDAANQNTDFAGGGAAGGGVPQTLLISIIANGTATDVIFDAYIPLTT